MSPTNPIQEPAIRDYDRSLDVLEQAIRSVRPERWDDPSAMPTWTARQVAGHAMTMIRNIVALAGDGPDPDFHARVDLAAAAGPDPYVTWTATRHLVESELLTRPRRLAAVRMTPLGAEMPIVELLGFQGLDPLLHGWDIATATGGTVDIPADLATAYLRRLEPLAEWPGAGLGTGDDPVHWLLTLCGR